MMELFRDQPLRGCLQAHVVSDEELSGKFGTIAVMDAIAAGSVPKPTYCLIGEKSDLKVRNAERGLFQMQIVFHGRASHTAAARVTGINAIAKAAKGILALEGDIDRFHPAVGKPVISVNMQSNPRNGSTKPNHGRITNRYKAVIEVLNAAIRSCATTTRSSTSSNLAMNS